MKRARDEDMLIAYHGEDSHKDGVFEEDLCECRRPLAIDNLPAGSRFESSYYEYYFYQK